LLFPDGLLAVDPKASPGGPLPDNDFTHNVPGNLVLSNFQGQRGAAVTVGNMNALFARAALYSSHRILPSELF
jgi:hypothetical protein